MLVRPAARHRPNIPPPAKPRPADATTIAPQRLHMGRHRGGNFADDGVRQHRICRHVEWIVHRGKKKVPSTVTSTVHTGVATRLWPSRNHAAGRRQDLVPLPPLTGPQVYSISRPPTSPAPRREHGQKRSCEARKPVPGERRRRALIDAVRATEGGRGATHHTPNVRRMGGPGTVRLVQAFLGLDSDRRDRRQPRKAPVSGRMI